MANNPPPILFPEWAPDLTTIGTDTGSVISGVVPQADGYGPFKSLAEFTQALPAMCRGYSFARRSDGSIAIFAGTATRLYLLNNTTFAWGDVSKSGAAYSALSSTDNWQFAQYNDLVLATQANTVVQKFILSSATEFADLGGSPPQAANIAIINRFVVLTGLLSAPRRVQWCDLDGPEVWTAGVGLADFQDLPDGGSVHGVVGGDAYGVTFQDGPVRSFIYAPGSSVTFQITKIAEQDALLSKYGAVQSGDRVFYVSAQGFKMVVGGAAPIPIGKERVDRFFFRDVDTSALQLVIAAADPNATRFYLAYKSIAGQAGLFDKVLCFDWSIGKNGRWTLLPISGEWIASLAKPGLTLEQLDAIAPTPLIVSGAADNGAGKVRLTISALSNANFSLGTVGGGASQNTCTVYGVLGTVEANVTAPYTVIDATHIDLPSVAFANAYVSGGQIGGSLDALPFSLDSISTASLAAISAMSSAHKAGFFTGANIEAILETPEADLGGNLEFVEGVRPISDSPDIVISLGSRMLASDAVVYSAESSRELDGVCAQLVEARYIKARARIPAGSVWSYARSVQALGQIAGEY